jgi:hypothetical protein
MTVECLSYFALVLGVERDTLYTAFLIPGLAKSDVVLTELFIIVYDVSFVTELV